MGKPEEHKQTQREKFIETARQIGADEDEAAFVEKMKKIAQTKPKGGPKEER